MSVNYNFRNVTADEISKITVDADKMYIFDNE